MPKPYPQEFRDDVVRVARNREPGQLLKTITADFGISESCLTNWMKTADVEKGVKRGITSNENAELREARKRIRLLEQENEVLRRAAARRGGSAQPTAGGARSASPSPSAGSVAGPDRRSTTNSSSGTSPPMPRTSCG